MTDALTRFHEEWLGLVQPTEGLVVSIPVLVDAQCLERQPPAIQQALLEICPPAGPEEDDRRAIRDLPEFLSTILGLTPDLFASGDALPEDLRLYVPEGRQTVRPTLALRRRDQPKVGEGLAPARAGARPSPTEETGAPFVLLVWEIPDALPFHRPETVTGPWDYPPAAKFDRLLRHCRVPIGLLTNRREIRLVYAPHGESTGSITFRIDDMASVGGRPILDAFVMLLSVRRFFAVAREAQLPALLAASRKRQANVTNDLAEQVFQAVETLLRGFEAAADRDRSPGLAEAARREDDHLYGGLLTVLLRLVSLLYAEDKGLLPVEHPFYEKHLSLFGLFEQLQRDQGRYPDSMARRFGAWDRLLALFRAIYGGVRHGDLQLPARRGELFDPESYPFLEGWGAGGAPFDAPGRAALRVPSIDDGTVFEVLKKLVFLGGQRLSYSSLDVEQIGSVYERLMGYHAVRVFAPAVCLRPSRVWITAREVLDQPAARRAKWLQETAGLAKAQAEKLAQGIKDAPAEEDVLTALDAWRVRGTERARPEQLVIQPGAERRRTSSHYTPKSLTGPIVRRTLEPLLAAMGPEPPSELILSLRVCDPAMGSGAFLVEACRFLADQLVAAWTREGRAELVASPHEDVNLHARRLVAQTCLYGVDKNHLAAGLAKISLWLETMARDLPFTFVDHAFRHGDSLVGLSFEQIRGFHWAPEAQLDFASKELDAALEEAIALRRQIQELAENPSEKAQKEKERLLWDANDALKNVRLIADLIVGAFFAAESDRERTKELGRRLERVTEWLKGGGEAPADLLEQQAEIRSRVPAFHWMIEFPEVFYAERPDPLDGGKKNGAAWMDAFVGNPPFLSGTDISGNLGEAYRDWVLSLHEGSHGKADLCIHFFRLAANLIGEHGTFGFIATNSVSEGESRLSGLKFLIDKGLAIYGAENSLRWPGPAAVFVSTVQLAKGRPKNRILYCECDGRRVNFINSRLRPRPERQAPGMLTSNATLCSQGTDIASQGFILSPAERELLLATDSKNSEVVFPYLGGERVNSDPAQGYDRYVINFSSMTLAEASHWPELLDLVRSRVKPGRDLLKSNSINDRLRQYWWRFWAVRPELIEALGRLRRCLVTAAVSKHRVFAFQPPDLVFAKTLYVFAFEEYSAAATLQTRLHACWARLLSSTLEERLRYSASVCFETFPFPQPDPRTVIPSLEDIGQRLYDTRAQYMLDTQQGLTDTYNLLKDPACHDPRIEDLRRLHEEMDRAVLDAYGWTDIAVPPYGTPTTDAERRALEAFEDEVIDRLFVLNAERAEEEKRQVLAAAPVKVAPKKRGRQAKNEGQASLLGE